MITIELVVVEKCKVEITEKNFVRSVNRTVRSLTRPDLYSPHL